MKERFHFVIFKLVSKKNHLTHSRYAFVLETHQLGLNPEITEFAINLTLG